MSCHKNFDAWNEKKKTTHYDGVNKFYTPREVWWCALGANVGYEQDGAAKTFERPVLILRGFSKHVCLIVPLTTSTKENPYHIAAGKVDGREAQAIISQIRLADTKRFSNKVGFLDKNRFASIQKAVKAML